MQTIRAMQISDVETVLALWNEACIEAIDEGLGDISKERIRKNLTQYATHTDCHCLIAEKDNEIVGFITFCILNHPIQSGYGGEIEDLYVQEGHRDSDVSETLVHQAVLQMKQQGAGVINTRVDADDADALTFWHKLNWSQDMVNFTIYSNVDDDGVWDSYQ